MTRRPFLLVLLLCLAAVGCDAFEGRRLVVGTILHTPEIVGPDGTTVPEITTAAVFFGEHDPLLDPVTAPPVGIVGADVRLSIFSDTVRDVPLADVGDGTYVARSDGEADLVYRSGASYRVEIDDFGDLFEVDAEQAPVPEPPDGVPAFHGAGEPMTVSRSQVRIAFIDVVRLEGGAALVWTNRPDDPGGLLGVVADPAPWQASEFTIPGEAFAAAGTHAVVLTTAVRGVPDFQLYSGSGVLVGSAEARLVTVE